MTELWLFKNLTYKVEVKMEADVWTYIPEMDSYPASSSIWIIIYLWVDTYPSLGVRISTVVKTSRY